MKRLHFVFVLALMVLTVGIWPKIEPVAEAVAANVACYKEQGGARWVAGSGCSWDVESGGEIDIESGGALKIAGVSVDTTAAELNLAADLSARFEDVTATNVITATECGKTFYLNSATEFESTLPAVSGAAGCDLTFIVKAAPASASYTIVTGNSLENVLIGHVVTSDLDGAADGDSGTADDTITITDSVAVVGDRVTFNSDGAKWYWQGSSKIYNAIVATQAD